MYTKEFMIPEGSKVRLSDFDPGYTASFYSKEEAEIKLEEDRKQLMKLQELLYAHNKYGVLLIFQAMDAAGKDSTIKHVMKGINPQGCQVHSFKVPSTEELDHDYMWRYSKALPERGNIGIFNRSYYEEVLVVRVHKELLVRQNLPDSVITDSIWKQRYRHIREYEKYLHENGFLILKFFLHVSKEEQKQRFLKRLENPEKNWKFSMSDIRERGHWDAYMDAYQDTLEHTSTEAAPWFVIPADKKWFMRMAVADIIGEAISGLPLKYPKSLLEDTGELELAKQELSAG